MTHMHTLTELIFDVLFSDLVVKIPVFEILWWRFFFTVGITGCINLFTGQSCNIFNVPNHKTVALAALLGTITAFCTGAWFLKLF